VTAFSAAGLPARNMASPNETDAGISAITVTSEPPAQKDDAHLLHVDHVTAYPPSTV